MKSSRMILWAAALLLASCSKRPVQPRFDTLVTETQLENDGLQCNVDFRFASIANASKSPALQAIEQTNIGYFFQLEEFTETAEKAAEGALAEITATLLSDSPQGYVQPAPYEIVVESEGAVVDTLVTYLIVRHSYTGGAHGMYTTECHTYSLHDGNELSAIDLFGAERLPRLRELIRQKIYEQYDAADDAALAAQGFFPEYIDITENFRLDGEGITFFYSPYEIGCYALGPVEVRLDRATLDSLLQDE